MGVKNNLHDKKEEVRKTVCTCAREGAGQTEDLGQVRCWGGYTQFLIIVLDYTFFPHLARVETVSPTSFLQGQKRDTALMPGKEKKGYIG